MVPIYLDDCIADGRIVRHLRRVGLTVYVPAELGTSGQSDELHLVGALTLSAVLATHNQQDFAPLHGFWEKQGRQHAGILLVRQQLPIGPKFAAAERAVRLLTPELAAG